ncbi:hypothetical protein Leryth_020776 [Lithospermum erythrorhizon]|nr:hypothetical protein Leryth_020776 [Lithospermum erythrorhizon]
MDDSLTSFTLKRPAFVNTSRSAEELKFSKTAIPKPSVCSIPRSAKSSLSDGSQLQHNQFVQSAANNQICTRSSKISTIKDTPQFKASSAASPSTSSSKLLKGNSIQATTAPPLHPSTRICQSPVTKFSDTGLKKASREVNTLGMSQTKGEGSFVIAPVPHRTNAGKSMHHAQFQAKKPSGLRMPSPSFRFFGQPKVSISNQPTPMSFKPNIPGLCNLHDHRKVKSLRDMKPSISTMPLSSTTENSALSDSEGESCETSESVLEQNMNKFVHTEISTNELPMNGVDAIDKLDKVQHETGEPIIPKLDSEHETSTSVLEQNISDHSEISYDVLPMHGSDAVDKSDKVHPQQETSESIILRAVGESKIYDTWLLLQPKEGNMEKSVKVFQTCSNDSDSTCSPSMSQILSALSEPDIICSPAVTSQSFTCELPLAAENIIPDKNRSDHAEISYDELPMHGADAIDKSDKVHQQQETSKRIILKAGSEHNIYDNGLLPLPDDGNMEKSIQVFQTRRINDNDLSCSPSMSQKLSALSGQHEGEIISNSAVTSQSFTCELPLAAENIVPDKNTFDHGEISYDELPMHGADAVDKSVKVHPQHETSKRIILKAISEHKIYDSGLLPQPEDGNMEKSIQGFQAGRSNDSDSTCSPLMSQKLSTPSGQHEGEIICNSAVTSESLTCELPLVAENIVPDKKSSTENHHELPTESCHQSLDQSDAAIFSAPEVREINKSNSTSKVPEHNTCKYVEVLAISGEMKCQAPESCDSELENSYFMSRGIYSFSTDAGTRTEVDDETYLEEGQSHVSNGMQTNFPKNDLNVKAVTANLMEYAEKHCEAERIHIAVEESSHCNLELCATGDLLPNREPREEKVFEVPSSIVTKESNERCENISFIEHFSLQGAMPRESSPSSQHKFDGLKNNLLEDDDNAEILYDVDTSAGEGLAHNSGSISTEKIKNFEKNSNKRDGQIILPKDLVPFSEDWLAAIEAAGEDVLTLKTGAVQNSPTDKSLPEPSPWSPVKRKTNQLGPFDCTKYTNPTPLDSPQ